MWSLEKAVTIGLLLFSSDVNAATKKQKDAYANEAHTGIL